MAADPSEGPVVAATSGAVAGLRASDASTTLVVAPTLKDLSNTLQPRPIPFACWKTDDIRFATDSSFPTPALRDDVTILRSLIEVHSERNASGEITARPVLSIFGHADPSSNDAYNKVLSGRRARSIYALLIRKTEIWESLHGNAEGTGDKWGKPAFTAMQDAINRQPADLKRYAGSDPHKFDHAATDAGVRKQLFAAYMDFLCNPMEPPSEFRLKPEEFLGGGKDPDGKADYQGCGEFNPIFLPSQKEEQSLPAAARQVLLAPDRRVMVLLWRPGTQIEPSTWPCPTTKEGVGGCRKRFWSDGDSRRNTRLPDEERRYEVSHDTFACRFYQRMVEASPCEIVVKKKVCCKHRGTVANNVDPMGMGRLMVTVPTVLGDTPAWALPCVAIAESGSGLFLLPPIGASVWVDFEEGDRERPVWSGCFWGSSDDLPLEMKQGPDRVVIKTETGMVLLDNTGRSIQLSALGVRVTMEAGSIRVTNAGGATFELSGLTASFNNAALEVI